MEGTPLEKSHCGQTHTHCGVGDTLVPLSLGHLDLQDFGIPLEVGGDASLLKRIGSQVEVIWTMRRKQQIDKASIEIVKKKNKEK